MNTSLIRNQLDQSLEALQPLKRMQPPAHGWIRTIRTALGMSGRQLAGRLGVTKQRVALMEKEESTGALSIKSMRKAGEALGCSFVYGFIPHGTLEDIVRQKAGAIIRQRLSRVSQSMALEDQAVSTAENTAILRDEVDRLIHNLPRNFWDQ